MKFRILASLFAAMLPVLAQSPTWSSVSRDPSGVVQFQVRFGFDPNPFEQPATAGAPYSATEVSIGPAIGINGATEQREEGTRRIFRDGQGRLRIERSLRIGPGAGETVPLVEITDYVAGDHYTLDLQNKIAYRSKKPIEIGANQGARKAAPGPAEHPSDRDAIATRDSGGSVKLVAPAPAQPQAEESALPKAVTATLPVDQLRDAGPAMDSLGTRIVEGIRTEGKGFTRTIATSSGSDPKMLSIRLEQWTSPELKVTVLSKVSDERNGDRTVALKNIRRGEPDAGLFRVPEGYQIQPVSGHFEMSFLVRR